jgi:hypothetical protein
MYKRHLIFSSFLERNKESGSRNFGENLFGGIFFALGTGQVILVTFFGTSPGIVKKTEHVFQ